MKTALYESPRFTNTWSIVIKLPANPELPLDKTKTRRFSGYRRTIRERRFLKFAKRFKTMDGFYFVVTFIGVFLFCEGRYFRPFPISSEPQSVFDAVERNTDLQYSDQAHGVTALRDVDLDHVTSLTTTQNGAWIRTARLLSWKPCHQ